MYYRIKILLVLFFALMISPLGLARPVPQVKAQIPTPLPDDLLQLIGELKYVPVILRDGYIPPPVQLADPGAPANVLRATQDMLQSIVDTTGCRQSARTLCQSLDEVKRAWLVYSAGSPDLSHLGKTMDALKRAQVKMEIAFRNSDLAGKRQIAILQTRITKLAARMATNSAEAVRWAGVGPNRLAVVKRQIDLGDLAIIKGNHVTAGVHFGKAILKANDTVIFDVALFKQNIIDALAGETTGHAFSIAYQGQLFEGGESSGFARTEADEPETLQSPTKEMHVASVSKTLTSIIVLQLLDENGLTPDTPVLPCLPSNWEPGNGVDQLTFKDFMTHRSGFGQNNIGNDYASMKAGIESNVGSTSFSYENANFGLMRVLVTGLMGIDPVDYPEFDPAVLTAAAFQIKADEAYDPIGVEIDCASNDINPTVQYNLPDGGASGYTEPNRQLTCGGYGWFISSNELAAVLTHLRNTENLLSTQARTKMQQDFLGFMDPANYSFTSGTYGTYYMHGGDWSHGSGELHSCVAAFPITVEVGLVINSERGDFPYQCSLLKNAFENAWVAK